MKQLADDLSEVALSEYQAHEALRRTHEELKLAQVQLVQAEKLAGLGQMVAGVAHEINNPLAFVSNNVAVLRRDVGQPARPAPALPGGRATPWRSTAPSCSPASGNSPSGSTWPTRWRTSDRLIDRSGEGLKRIQQIVKDLRDFARLDEGDLKEVDLNEGIRSTRQHHLRPGRGPQGVELEMDLAPLPPAGVLPGQGQPGGAQPRWPTRSTPARRGAG